MNAMDGMAITGRAMSQEVEESNSGIPSGLTELDKIIREFRKSELVVIASRPDVPKSAFALSVVSHIAISAGKSSAYFSREMSGECFLEHLLAIESRIEISRLRSGFLMIPEMSSFSMAAKRIFEAPVFIEVSPDLQVSELQKEVKSLRENQGIEIVLLDYLSLLQTGIKNETLPGGNIKIAASLKRLASELCIPVVVLTRLPLDGKATAPTLDDLRYSCPIEPYADVVILIHHGKTLGDNANGQCFEVELIVAKNTLSSLGTANVKYIARYSAYENLQSTY
jgi:replicative DNA helicase